MDRRFAYQDSLQDRIAAATEVMRVALDKQAPYLALATAREAARAALLALGEAPLRAGKRELTLLREVATVTSQRFAGRPAERQAMVSATLDLLERLFPHPALAEGQGGGITAPAPALPRGATRPARRRSPPGQGGNHGNEHSA